MGKKERFYADVMAAHPEVTGSCNIVTVRLPSGEKFHFIVDCGLFQEREHEEYNKNLMFNPLNIDFCLVTHAHVDHIGRFPLMVKKGYRKSIYATEDTKKVMFSALDDSAKVIRETARRRNEKPLYVDADVDETMRLVVGCSFGKWVHVRSNVDVAFFNNGHLFGASMILVKISYPGENDINLLFTGDYNNKNVFLDIAPLPNWVYGIPVTIIQEATYGDMNSSEIERCFVDNVVKKTKGGGIIVVPVFSLGRMQEILYLFKILQNRGKISSEIPIYVDGKLGIKYTIMCKNGEFQIKDEMKEFLPENVIFVDKSTRIDVINDKRSKIIVTTSGMGSYGPAQVYIPTYITNKNALIHFTGYTAEGTLGRALKDAPFGEVVKIGGVFYRKAADVEYTNEFSAHAKADEMIEFLKQFTHLNLVLVNHGEVDKKEVFAKRILDEVNARHVGVLGRQYFFRINPYGLVDSKATKFL